MFSFNKREFLLKNLHEIEPFKPCGFIKTPNGINFILFNNF